MINKTLSECLSSFIDRRGVTPKKLNTDWKPSGYRVLSANNVKSSGLINQNDIRCIDEETYKKWMKDEIQKGDLLLTSEAPAGEILYWDSDEKIVAGQRIFVLKTKDEIDSRYLKYYLQSEQGQNEIKNKCSGSTVFGISNKMFDSIIIRLPETINEQSKIADILYTIDKTITNNNKISAELESLAKIIYDYWFLQFEFPNEEGKPYKSSGGKMVYNEELNREIPEGWEVKNLVDVLVLLKDGTHNPPKRVDKGIPLLTGTMFGNMFLDYSQATNISESDYHKIHSQYAPQKDDITLTKIGTLGNVNYLRQIDIPIAVHCNSALLRFPEQMRGAFGLLYCKSDEFYKRLKSAKGQSIQEFCSLDKIGSIKMLVPDDEVIIAFNCKTNPLLRMLEQKSIENQQLASLRDWLLPMLMNGQVTIQ